jgi:hypothetical protein
MYTDTEGIGFVELKDNPVDYRRTGHWQKEAANPIGDGANACVHREQVNGTDDCSSESVTAHSLTDPKRRHSQRIRR